MHKSAISWFEIPTNDLERATKFYEAILQLQLQPMDMGELKMRMFPIADMQYDGAVGGALIHQGDMFKPSGEGTMVYMNANPDLQAVLDRVEEAGGSIAMPKTLIAEGMGNMAVVMDTEGNRVGLYSFQ